jgi:ABC-type transporter Mla subunit MlaD
VRRLAAIVLALPVAVVLALLATGAIAQGSSQGRFDVIFDDARGLVAGQLVKIAGAQAGTIQNVVVTPDFKARIEASVDSRFLPFHQDATCTIRPQGLIAENYVECDPGSANSRPLQAKGGMAPTVPVRRTTEPVSLLDLFNIFNQPTRERLTVLVNELGIATAARGQDLNDLLRRANPSLALARQVIGILNSQRSQLATIADATNTIAAEGAGHTQDVQRFLDRAATLTSLTASHRGALAQAIKRLPAMLAAARPALARLDTVAVDGTPLLRQIHTAVPSLNRLSADLGPFVKAARPGLQQLAGAVSKAVPTLEDTAPLLRTLRGYADRSKSGTLLTARLFENLQQHGFVENFLSVTYYIAASLARFDTTSHMLAILLISPDNGVCGNYATTPVPACSAHYGRQAAFTPAAATAKAKAKTRAKTQPPARQRASTTTKPAGAKAAPPGASTRPTTPTTPGPPAAPPATGTPQSPLSPAGALAAAEAAAQAAAKAAANAAAGSAGAPQRSAQSLQNLVNYLLK